MKEESTNESVKLVKDSEESIVIVRQKPAPPVPEPEEQRYTIEAISMRENSIEEEIASFNARIADLEKEKEFLLTLKNGMRDLQKGEELDITPVKES
jgi:hypothetical protein